MNADQLGDSGTAKGGPVISISNWAAIPLTFARSRGISNPCAATVGKNFRDHPETEWRSTCTLHNDEGVLNAGGNVKYFAGPTFGSFSGTPEAQTPQENDEDLVRLAMTVAR